MQNTAGTTFGFGDAGSDDGLSAYLDDDDVARPAPATDDDTAASSRRVSEPFMHGEIPTEHVFKPIAATVSLMNGTPLQLVCEHGKYTTAQELETLVATSLGLSAAAAPLFALWIVSDSLSLQLKRHHHPVKVMRSWPELLHQYATCDPASELPVLSFARDAFVTASDERMVTDTKAIKLLCEEMAFNVVFSRYPCSLADAAHLAAIQLRLECPESATDVHCADINGCMLPVHLEETVKAKEWQRLVLENYNAQPARPFDRVALYKEYLEFGRRWPFYGCTFFHGEVEPPVQSRFILREVPNEDVLVGVNADGIHVISEKTNTIKVSLTYDELKFNSYQDPESGSSFLIEYDSDDHTLGDITAADSKQTLVVWTPQAAMIDTLVVRFIDAMHDSVTTSQPRPKDRRKSVKPHLTPLPQTGGSNLFQRMGSLFFARDQYAPKSPPMHSAAAINQSMQLTSISTRDETPGFTAKTTML